MASSLALHALILPALLGLSLAIGWALAGPLRRVPAHSVPEKLLVWALIGIVAFSWIGTIMAALDRFRWPLVCGILAVTASVVWVYGRIARKAGPGDGEDADREPSLPPQPTPAWAVLAALAILGGAAVLYARPAESFYLVDDSAVYTIAGVLLARTGSLLARPEVFWQTTENFVHQFMGVDPFLMNARHFGPFFQWTAGQTSMEIGFLPLPKVWTALVVWLWGPAQATWAIPFFGVMGLALLYGLVRRSVGWPAGLASIVLLAVSLPQVWFARYPLSEAYTQVFLLGGVYLAVLARQNTARPRLARWLAFWSALSLAGLTLLRFEAAVLLLLLGGFLALGWRRIAAVSHAFVRPWLLTLALTSAYGLAIGLGVARHYLFAQTLVTATPGMVGGGLIALAVLGLLGIGYAWRHWALWPLVDRANAWLPWIYIGLWGVWLALAGWQLAIRGLSNSLTGWLVQYWTPTGVILGAAGLAWILWQERCQTPRPELTALIGLGLALLIAYTINPAVNPVHPWAVRRLVPAALPILALGAGTLFAAGVEPLRRLPTGPTSFRLWPWVLAAGALVLLLAQSLMVARVSWPLWGHRELDGFYEQVEAIADRLPPDTILLFDNGQIGERLTQVFEFVFGHPALSIRATPASQSSSAVDALVEAARARGHPVFLAITDGDLTWHTERWQLAGRGADRIDTMFVSPTKGRPPGATDVVSRTLWLDLYEILPRGDTNAVPRLPLDLPIGTGSYPYFRDGFWNWKLDAEGDPYRWTDGYGKITVPWPSGAGAATPTDLCLVLAVAGGRPIDAEHVRLQVRVEGALAFSDELPPGFDGQVLKLPMRNLTDQGAPGLEIELDSTTWQPNGEQVLGVLLREVEIADVAACAR